MTPKNGIRKRKYPLVFATAVAFLSVCTAGVSTFAWFQASAQVQISSVSSSTTISVSAPDSVELDFVKIYRRNSVYSESTNIVFSEGSEPDEFTEITGNGTNFRGMAALDRATFCVVVQIEENTREITGGELKLVSYDSVKPAGSGTFTKLNQAATATDGVINFSDAIVASGAIKTSPSTTYTYSSGSSLSANMPLATSDSINSNAVYFYFTLEFSNSSLFDEYVYADSVYTRVYNDQPKGNNRFFAPSATGSSNCYVGWTFWIRSLSVSVY